MVSVDWSAAIQILNFIFLIGVLNIVLFKPVRNILTQRKEKVEGLEQSIQTFSDDALESEKAFDAGIRQARANGLKQKDALIDSASKEEQAIIAKITEKAQVNLGEARKKISEDIKGVQTELQKEIDSFAKAIGKKILGRAVK